MKEEIIDRELTRVANPYNSTILTSVAIRKCKYLIKKNEQEIIEELDNLVESCIMLNAEETLGRILDWRTQKLKSE